MSEHTVPEQPSTTPEPADDAPATRLAVYAVIHEGITKHGLALPTTIGIRDGVTAVGVLSLGIEQNDTAAVDAWITFLRLPMPATLRDDMLPTSKLRVYDVTLLPSPLLSGWLVDVCCYCETPESRRKAARVKAARARKAGA